MDNSPTAFQTMGECLSWLLMDIVLLWMVPGSRLTIFSGLYSL